MFIVDKQPQFKRFKTYRINAQVLFLISWQYFLCARQFWMLISSALLDSWMWNLLRIRISIFSLLRLSIHGYTTIFVPPELILNYCGPRRVVANGDNVSETKSIFQKPKEHGSRMHRIESSIYRFVFPRCFRGIRYSFRYSAAGTMSIWLVAAARWDRNLNFVSQLREPVGGALDVL